MRASNRSDEATKRRSDKATAWWLLTGCAIAHVLFFIAAFPPIHIWFLIVLAPAPLAWIALRAPTMRAALVIAFLAQLAVWYTLGFWLIQITELGYPFYAPYLALFGAVFVWLIRRLHTAPTSRLAASLPLTITIPTIWVALEFLRGSLLFDGYPWFLLAHPLVEVPLLVQSADLLGTYFISFLAAMVSGMLLDFPRFTQRATSSSTQEERAASSTTRRWPRTAAIAIACLALLANLAYGIWRMQPLDEEPGPTMLVVQTDLPQDNKMRATPEERMQQFHEFVVLMIEGMQQARQDGRDIDLIIWPETMVFGFGFEPDSLDLLEREGLFPGTWPLRNLELMIEEFQTAMLVGSLAYENLRLENDSFAWDAVYNAAYVLDVDGSMQRYDKIHLTPFGETMPYISNWPWLEERLLALAARGMTFELEAGESSEPLALNWENQPHRIAAPICFEITMPHIIRRLVYDGGEKQADVLINLSNDGWFGWYDAGRAQHAQISRFRAVENRIPVVRSVNTGHSVMIDAQGRVIAGIGEGRYGEARRSATFVAETVRIDEHTLYGRIGDSFAWLCLAGALGLMITSRFRAS